MIELAVAIVLPDGAEAHVGDAVFGDADAHGRYAGEFRYTAQWLAHPGVFAIDPESLPLSLGRAIVRSENLRPPLSVFDDALPDRWGRALLVAGHRLPAREQTEPRLLELVGDAALGALRFRPRVSDAPAAAPAAPLELGELLDAADRFERRLPIADATLQRLLAAGGTPGGARPKALVQHGNEAWLAKFPSRVLDEGLDIVGLEATSLVLARRAGINVPDFEVVRIGKRRVLLVKRFDLTIGGGRRHMLSFRTLCREWPGAHVFDYGELAGALRRHAAQPAAQLAQFFRRVAFNAVLGNTDDHLKNFWLLHDEHGWALTPAFDLLPDTGRRRQHTLAFDLHADPPDRATMLRLGQRWGVKQAAGILDEVVAAAMQFSTVAARMNVPAASIAVFADDIARRRAGLRASVVRNSR